jgi:nitroimidazol reductase NimA-like FMN-containing flavoprotein (pyridoxamine 5'-phosphate oxidase superfamily)
MTIEQLEEYGIEQIDDDAISAFLESHSTGVLGLSTADVPYLIPLAYGFDGDASLYFTFLLGGSSQKEALTEQAGRGRFLVFDVRTAFNWRSVLLTGTLSAVPEDDWAGIEAVMGNTWRPPALENASSAGRTAVYEFEIEERVGIEQTGLAPGFQEGEKS